MPKIKGSFPNWSVVSSSITGTFNSLSNREMLDFCSLAYALKPHNTDMYKSWFVMNIYNVAPPTGCQSHYINQMWKRISLLISSWISIWLITLIQNFTLLLYKYFYIERLKFYLSTRKVINHKIRFFSIKKKNLI